MLDGYGSRQSTVQPQQLVWENVAINSILAINNVTQPNSTNLPQLIRIPNFNFDIRTKKLINTGAAVSLVSCNILFKPTCRTISGQEFILKHQYD